MGRFAGGDILQRSKRFALTAIKLARRLSKDATAQHVGKQLVGSATSVGANLHEADMADGRRDFCNKVNIAQKEASEAAYWVSLLRGAELLPVASVADIENEAVELRKIYRQIVHETRRSSRPT